MDIFAFFDAAQEQERQERQAREDKRRAAEARREARRRREAAQARREEQLRATAEERGKDWDPDNVIPRICQSVVSRWGLPSGYEMADYIQDVSLRVWANPWDPERAGGRSFTSWVYLLAQSTWKNAVAKSTRRRDLAPMCSYEERSEMGLM